MESRAGSGTPLCLTMQTIKRKLSNQIESEQPFLFHRHAMCMDTILMNGLEKMCHVSMHSSMQIDINQETMQILSKA